MQQITKHQKSVPSPQIFTTPIYPPSKKVAKTSWTLPLDFQTVCIYGLERFGVVIYSRQVNQQSDCLLSSKTTEDKSIYN